MMITYTPDEDWLGASGIAWHRKYGYNLHFDSPNGRISNPAEGVYMTVPGFLTDENCPSIDVILEWIELDHHAEVRIVDPMTRRSVSTTAGIGAYKWVGRRQHGPRYFISFTIDDIEYFV